jgi:hypothetical protein
LVNIEVYSLETASNANFEAITDNNTIGNSVIDGDLEITDTISKKNVTEEEDCNDWI